MDWYVAKTEETDTRPLFPAASDLMGRNWEDFCRGELIMDWDESAWFAVRSEMFDGRADDALWNHLFIPIYSARLRNALVEAGIGEIQYLPVQVYRLDGSLVSGYAIANVLHCSPVLDLEKSEYSPFYEPVPEHRGMFVNLTTRVLRNSALTGHDILRPKEYPTDLYVSERFRQVFQQGGFTGYAFRRLQRSE